MTGTVSNIKKYHKKPGFNIGLVLFGLAFFYIFANIITFFMDKNVTIYEVRQGSIYRDTSYSGLVLRQEMVVQTDRDGYVSQLAVEGSRVGARTLVYAMTDEKLTFAEAKEEEINDLSKEQSEDLYAKIQAFSSHFTTSSFSDVYQLKGSIDTAFETNSTNSKKTQIDGLSASATPGLNLYNAAHEGIISYQIDGYETLSVEELTKDMIEKKEYQREELLDQEQVKAANPVYKVITDDAWKVAILIDDDTAQELIDKKSVSVKFAKDGVTDVAGIQVFTQKEANIAILSFNKGMVRYYNERYVDLDLILANAEGLKIPVSAVTKKSFYEVPDEYLTKGGNSTATGVLVDNGSDNPTFVPVNIYAKDEEKELSYIDPTVFESNQKTLVKTTSKETYTLEKTKDLEGVYNINRGYATFRKIEVKAKNDDYYIVTSGNAYGISNYDHIALDSGPVVENEVVF
ncbi:hypothetical protein M2150_000301 [Lachnospiraceae bacterium PM6-15]|uniref:HlyD family efflux transporter periplasmic adaptor subunit n=1 Tax=Ohessyouella blattaphilus TaxID=2949333 RepID=UPI003E18A6E5